MCNLCQRGQIIGARLAGASVTKMSELLNVSWAVVSMVMTAYTKQSKTSSAKSNSERKPKLTERDRQALKQNVAKNKTTAAKVTSELITHLTNTISTCIVH